MKKCQNCGTKNADSAKLCNFCDTPFPTAEEKEAKKVDYVHDSHAAKKHQKRKIIVILLVVVLVFSALIGLFTIVFKGKAPEKSSDLYAAITSPLKNDSSFSGVITSDKEITFTGNIKDSVITVQISGGEYDKLTISKDEMFFEKEGEKISVDDTMESYKIYVAYLLLTSTEKNVFEMKSKDIEADILPIIKSHVIKDFDNIFSQTTFADNTSSLFSNFKNKDNKKNYMRISFPEDIKNGKTTFDIKAYDLQNFVLSEYKRSYKNSDDYDKINTQLKNVKSYVKENYGAKGSITTENGKIKSADSVFMYDGKTYTMTISFE